MLPTSSLLREPSHDEYSSQVAPVEICIAPEVRTVCLLLSSRRFMCSNWFLIIASIFFTRWWVNIRYQTHVCALIYVLCSDKIFPTTIVVRYTLFFLLFYKPESVKYTRLTIFLFMYSNNFTVIGIDRLFLNIVNYSFFMPK